MPKSKNIHISLNKSSDGKWKITQFRQTLSTHRTQKATENYREENCQER